MLVLFVLKIYLFIGEREREREREHALVEGGRESQVDSVLSIEPDVRLDPMTPEIRT